jgi:hypothetical protein
LSLETAKESVTLVSHPDLRFDSSTTKRWKMCFLDNTTCLPLKQGYLAIKAIFHYHFFS